MRGAMVALWLLAGLTALAGGKANRRPPVTSSPRRPAKAKYYPPKDLLNCEGANFSSSWRDFRQAVAANVRAGYPRDLGLHKAAARIRAEWMESSLAGSIAHVGVLLRQRDATELGDFCLYGFATALWVLFRHAPAEDLLLIIKGLMGWEVWPLDFSESSDWPRLYKHVPMHLEQAQKRGDTSWSASFNRWGKESLLLSRPAPHEIKGLLGDWLDLLGVPDVFPPARLAGGLAPPDQVRILVAGHHLGSSMEPYTMLRRALAIASPGTGVDVQFHGQRHPAQGIVCLEFGYCNTYKGLEDWFRRYETRWLGEYDWMSDRWLEVLEALAGVVEKDPFLTGADCVVCGGPAWFCVMLRTVRPTLPMLLYFAWPLAPMVPGTVKPHLLAHLQVLSRTFDPPTVFIAANWLLAAQFALQIHIVVPVHRPHGLYANQTYAPVVAPNGLARILFSRLGQWTLQSGPALLEQLWSFVREEQHGNRNNFPFELVFLSVRVRGIEPIFHLSYAELAEFHACVFWPWDEMMLLFDELYTMTMPLLVPDRHWMHSIMLHALRHSDFNWWHLRAGSVAGGLPAAGAGANPYPLPYMPWIGVGGGIEEVAYWYELTDFAQFPHLTYFSSLPEMLWQIKNLDVPSVRAGMSRFNRATLLTSLQFYRRAAVQLLLP